MKSRFTVICLFLMYSFHLKAEKMLSEFELGLGYGGGIVPDYPASNEYQTRSLPLPIVIYRGEVLKSDQDEGTRAELFKTEGLEINLSFSGSFSSISENNKARQGLPNLNYIFELGPSLTYRFFEKNPLHNILLQIPLRLAFETDFERSSYLSPVFEPTVSYRRNHVLIENLRSISALSLRFFGEGVAEYFYNVQSEFALPDRPVYQAKAGFSDYSLSQAFIFENRGINFVIGASLSKYELAANKNSPLYKTDTNTSFFAAMAWVFYQKSFESE